MRKLSTPLRITGMLLLLAVGLFSILGPVSPGAESVAGQQAIRAGAYGQSNNMPTSAGSAYGVSEATMVNLADVEFKPIDSMFDRWQRGELDFDERESKLSAVEQLALQEEARNMAPQTGAQPWDSPSILGGGGSSPDDLVIVNKFDALDIDDCCGGGLSVPPDSDMAAGVNYLIAVENSSFEIYNKSGGVVIPATLFDNFFSVIPECTGLFDPTVMYDSEEDRFVMGIEDGQYFCLAVTANVNDPYNWYLYAFDALHYGDEFFDYPHIGIGDHAIFMGSNMFGGSVPGGFEGRMYAMDKNAAYTGSLMSWRSESAGYDGSTPQPLNLTGFAQGTVPQPFDTHFFISDYYDGTTAWLWAWPDALGTGVPTVVQTYDLNTLTGVFGGYPLDVAQKDTSEMIMANDWRFRGFEYRNGQGWTTDTVSLQWSGWSTTTDVARYFTMDLTTAPYAAIAAEVGGYTDKNVIFPDLAVDACGNMALGHGVASEDMYVSLEVGGVRNGGMWAAPSLVKAGEAPYGAFDGVLFYNGYNRWGDYSGMAIDPDGTTFWFMGEYAKDLPNSTSYPDEYYPNYGNYIAEVTYGCGWIFETTAIRWSSNAFDYNHGWRVDQHPRMFADVDGDGDDDAVGFGLDGIYVALSNGTYIADTATKWSDNALDYAHGWRVDQHPRMFADVDGDGNADAVGFGLDGIYVALSTGTSIEDTATMWSSNAFDYEHGWRVDSHPRMLADVDGDGDADAVGFGLDGIYVALSDGSSFEDTASKWTSAFDYASGWRVDSHPRMLADVDGDGDADAVGFGLDGIYVALSDGSSFAATTTKWTSAFDYNHGWRVDSHPRMLADVDGDGIADAVGFGLDGVYVAFSNGSSFDAVAELGTPAFDYNHGWRVDSHPRMLADVNGDHKADALGFGFDGIYVAPAQ